MKSYNVRIEMLAELYGLVDEDTEIQEIAEDILVELHSITLPFGEVDVNDVDISSSGAEPGSILTIPSSKFEYYGLDDEEGMVAYLVNQLVVFEFALEIQDDADPNDALSAISIDWESYSNSFDLLSGSSKMVSEAIELV